MLRTSDGFDASKIASTEEVERLRPGGAAGTATIPAYRQPKNAAIKSRPGGNSSSARSPAPSATAARRRWPWPAGAAPIGNAETALTSPRPERKRNATRPPVSDARIRSKSTSVIARGGLKGSGSLEQANVQQLHGTAFRLWMLRLYAEPPAVRLLVTAMGILGKAVKL